MSRREIRERRRREKEERRNNSSYAGPVYQTGGWYEEIEAFTEEDPVNTVTTVSYTHPAPTAFVSESDKKEQEWNQTQNRMHPIPDSVQRYTRDLLEVKKENKLESKLGFTPYFKKDAMVHRVVAMDRADYEFINDVYEKEKSMEHSGSIEMPAYDMNMEQSRASLFKTLSSKVCYRYVNLEAIHDDLQVWHGSKNVEVSHSAAMHMKETRDHVILRDRSWHTDPIGDYRLYVPDKDNYKREEEKCQKIHSASKEEFFVDFVKISGVNCNYILSLHTGFQPRIHLRYKGRSTSRRVLFRNTYKTLDCAMSHLKSYKNLVGARQLNNFECNFINHNYLGKIRNNLLGNQALELLFGSDQDYNRCLREHRGNITDYPYEADENLVLNEDETIGAVLSWYPYPSTTDAEIIVEDPNDVGFAYWILFSYGFHLAPGFKKYDPGNTLVEFNVPENIAEAMSYDNDAFLYAMKKILDGNGLKYKRINLVRCTEPSPSSERIIFKIHQRMGRAAVCTNLWDSFSTSRVPGYDEEWGKYISHHHHNFPWEIELDDYVDPLEEDRMKMQKTAEEARANSAAGEFPGVAFLPCRLEKSDARLGKMRRATVHFKDVNYGNIILNYLLPISPRWDTFAISHRDKLGVRFDPFYRIRRHVPHFVRNAIDEFIKNYDVQLRSQSNRRGNEWCRFIDVCHAEQVIVEGWPMARVQEAAGELDKRLKGITLDCSSPDGCGKLLHWPGIAFLNYLQEKHHKSAVISLNRLEKKVVIIGDVHKCEEIKKELHFFTRNRHRYIIKAKICINEPRFLHSFGEYLQRLIKNSPLCYMEDDILNFQGSVFDYERLQEKLDEQQQLVLEYYQEQSGSRNVGNKEITLRRSKCPICLNKVGYSNYRLSVCGHLYCMECLCNMIVYHIQQKDFPIRCLFLKDGSKSECQEFMAISDIVYLLYDENFKRYPLFFKDRVDVLVNAATDWAIQNSRGLYRHCSKPGCTGLFNMDLMSKKEGGIGISRCDVCRTKVCNRCLYPPHSGVSCEVEAAIRESSEKSINYYLTNSQGKVQRCPGDCGGIIEKNAGCNHMQCRFCKIHFCWLCQFKSYEQSEIYGHMSDVHNGTGGGWDFLDIPGFAAPAEQNFELAVDNDEEQQEVFGRNGFPAWVMIDGDRVEITD